MSVLEEFSDFYQHLGTADLNRLAKIYTEDVCFIDPVGTHQGLNKVIHYFERLLIATRSCVFVIHNTVACNDNPLRVDYFVSWTMQLELNSGKKIALDGLTELKINNEGIYYHRDYYDMGQMIYEHVPLLGTIIRFIKRRLTS